MIDPTKPLSLASPDTACRAIASRLKSLRLAKNITQETLGGISGVSAIAIRRFEATGRIPLQSLASLAWALGVERDLDQLFAAPPPASVDEVRARRKARQRARS